MTTYKVGDKVAFSSHPTPATWSDDDPIGTVIAVGDPFGRATVKLDKSGRTIMHFPGNLIPILFPDIYNH